VDEVSQAPTRIPQRGAVLQLGQFDTAWQGGMVLRVVRARPEISLWYGGEFVWVEGVRLDRRDAPAGRVEQVLVRCAAIR